MNKALAFIFSTVLIDVIGIAIIIPIIPELLEELTGKEVSETAGIGGLLLATYALMQFLFSPILGELSDHFGRRPILLISLLGLGIDYIFHAIAPTIMWLFIGRFIAGIFGASFSVATAYIADISTKENKAKNFGLIGVAFGVGFMIGPVIGGIAGTYGTRIPFYIAATLSLLNFLFGLFFIPESLPKQKRRKMEFKKMLPFVSIAHLKKYKFVLGMVSAFVLMELATQVLPSTWSFFTAEWYGWDEKDIGISLGIIGLLVGIVQGGLIGYVVKKYGNKKTIITGFILWTIGMILMSLSFNQWILYGAMIPFILGGIAGPTLQSLISNQVPENEQGNLQGAINSIISLTAFVGPLVFTSIFSFFTVDEASPYYFPGAAFVLGAFILIFASIIAYLSIRKKNFDDE